MSALRIGGGRADLRKIEQTSSEMAKYRVMACLRG
jgi:siroheme synthase (precorrin-2 oxidase/ferrochelatase)